MNIEKLKPWNWFKHEDDTDYQIPVSKSEATSENQIDVQSIAKPKNQAFNSLMQLHNEMERLFDDVWHSFGVSSRSARTEPSSLIGSRFFNKPLLGGSQASLDVSGSDTEYEVSIDLPGLSENDIQIELNGHTLTVAGKKEDRHERKEKHYYRVERSVGAFQRTLSLPEDADLDGIAANMKNGLLEIKIPRKALPKDKVKQISISS